MISSIKAYLVAGAIAVFSIMLAIIQCMRVDKAKIKETLSKAETNTLRKAQKASSEAQQETSERLAENETNRRNRRRSDF